MGPQSRVSSHTKYALLLSCVSTQRSQQLEPVSIFVCTGLREEVVTCKQDVYELVKVGERNRHYGATQMNEHSSRSHVLFRLVIESRQCETTGGKVTPIYFAFKRAQRDVFWLSLLLLRTRPAYVVRHKSIKKAKGNMEWSTKPVPSQSVESIFSWLSRIRKKQEIRCYRSSPCRRQCHQ